MAEDVKVSKTAAFSKGISKFFREIRSELKKVIWPTRQQLINNTMTVLLSCLVIGIIIWGFDSVFNEIVKSIFAK